MTAAARALVDRMEIDGVRACVRASVRGVERMEAAAQRARGGSKDGYDYVGGVSYHNLQCSSSCRCCLTQLKSPMLAAVGVVGADGQPLFVRSFAADEEPHRIHSLLYCALDTVDDRLEAPKKGVPAEAYLGLIGPAHEYQVFGYAACTRVKLFLVLDEVRQRQRCVPLLRQHSIQRRSCARRTYATRSSDCTRHTWTRRATRSRRLAHSWSAGALSGALQLCERC